MLLLSLLSLTTFAEAFVRLQNSVLYDEVDLKNVAQISTDMCAAGCKVYATTWTSTTYEPIMKNIFVHDPNMDKNNSVYYLSSIFMQDSQEKAYLEIGNAPTVTIYNTNSNLESGPLTLWIVSTKSPYYLTAEVYEPQRMELNRKKTPFPITILSERAFTVTAEPSEDEGGEYHPFQDNAIFARTVGYDAIDRNSLDNCYIAMDKDFGDNFRGFSLAINGPLLTIHFDSSKYPNSQVKLTADPGLYHDQPLKGPIFLSSPGFVCGSSSSSKVFRSNELSTGVEYTLITANNQETTINFDIDVVSDEDHPVKIYDKQSGNDFGFYGNFEDGTNSVQVQMQSRGPIVSFTPGTADSFFGMRVSVDDVQESSTKGASKTTSSPEGTTSYTGTHPFIIAILSTVVLLIA